MLPRSGAPARYLTVAADLCQRITSGEFTTGILPPERSLMGHYAASRNTLRTALAQLEAEGLLARQQGAMHRVRSHPERTLVHVDTSSPIEVSTGPATDAERELLDLPVGAWVLRVRDFGQLDADGEPVVTPHPAAGTTLRFGGDQQAP
jgi:DNA-binding GntR family transcriptional regulator